MAKLRFGVLLGFAHLMVAGTIPPIWTTPSGAPITSWDSVDSGIGLKTIDFPSNFIFPMFGQQYTSATVSSNGSLYFDSSPSTSQPQASVSELLQGLPRIAPAWYDTDAISGSGSIVVQLLSSNQLVFTWENLPSYIPQAGQKVPASDLATFQLTLDSDGSIIFAYQAFNALNPATTGVVNSLVGSQQAIVGITDGYGASDPGSVNLSVLAAASGSQMTTSNTIYQLVNNNPPDGSNFAGLDLIFTPESQGGWQVASEATAPAGPSNDFATPEPATDIEMILAALTLAAFWYHQTLRAKQRNGNSALTR